MKVKEVPLSVWQNFTLEEKTAVAYEACYEYLKDLGDITTIRQYYVPGGFKKWKKDCGNDWRGLVDFTIKKYELT